MLKKREVKQEIPVLRVTGGVDRSEEMLWSYIMKSAIYYKSL